jgi:hypothetical protein
VSPENGILDVRAVFASLGEFCSGIKGFAVFSVFCKFCYEHKFRTDCEFLNDFIIFSYVDGDFATKKGRKTCAMVSSCQKKNK